MQKTEQYNVSVQLTKDKSHTLYSEQFGATYHSIHGAIQESAHVFIKNGLEFCVSEHKAQTLSILEIGFGTGLNALLTYEFSRERKLVVNYQAVEAFPISLEIVQALNYAEEIGLELQDPFFKMHQCEFGVSTTIDSLFSITKYPCLIEKFKSDERFDVIYFDAFSPTQQPELWTEDVFMNMFQLLKPNGILVTYCAQGQMKRNMKTTGFKITTLPGPPGKREMTRGLKF